MSWRGLVASDWPVSICAQLDHMWYHDNFIFMYPTIYPNCRFVSSVSRALPITFSSDGSYLSFCSLQKQVANNEACFWLISTFKFEAWTLWRRSATAHDYAYENLCNRLGMEVISSWLIFHFTFWRNIYCDSCCRRVVAALVCIIWIRQAAAVACCHFAYHRSKSVRTLPHTIDTAWRPQRMMISRNSLIAWYWIRPRLAVVVSLP